MRAIPQRQPLFLGGSIGGVPSFDLNFARGDNAVTKYGFVFTRATSATYVNSTGLIATAASGELRYTYDPVTLSALGVLIEEARTNLVSQSSAFDTATGYWNLVNISAVTANTVTSPSGATDAEDLVETAFSTSRLNVGKNGISGGSTGAFCGSVFIKRRPGSQTRHVRLIVADNLLTNYAQAYVNLDTGALNTAASGLGASAPTSVTGGGVLLGNGWVRVWVAGTFSTTVNNLTLWGTDASFGTSYSGDTSSGFHIWGAQLEAGAFPTSYIPTAGAAATRNADVLSLTGAAGRTNLSSYSETWGNAYWTNLDTTISNDGTLSYSGASGSWLATEGSAGTAWTTGATSATAPTTSPVTVSVYLKRGSHDFVRVSVGAFASLTNGANAWFNLNTGTAGTTSARGLGSSISSSITSAGSGWYRCSLTVTCNDGTNVVGCIIASAASDGSTTRVSGGTRYQTAIQVETGSSATTYIPTTSGPRTVENVASWFNGDAGTMYAEYRSNGVTSQTSNVFAFYDIGASGTNRILLYHSNAGKAQTQIDSQSSAQMTSSSSMTAVTTAGTRIQAALAYAKDDGAISAQGASATADTSLILPVGMYQCGIGRSNYATALFNGTISRLRYYPRRLPNATLQSLTT